MNNKGIIVVIVFLSIVLGGGYMMYSTMSPRLDDVAADERAGGLVEEVGTTTVRGLPVSHVFAEGTHTYAGKINLPTPCHNLNNTITVTESQPESVVINFVTATRAEKCPEIITPEPFSVSFKASEDAAVVMMLNNKDLPFTVVMENGVMKNIEVFSSASSTASSSEEEMQEEEQEESETGTDEDEQSDETTLPAASTSDDLPAPAGA